MTAPSDDAREVMANGGYAVAPVLAATTDHGGHDRARHRHGHPAGDRAPCRPLRRPPRRRW